MPSFHGYVQHYKNGGAVWGVGKEGGREGRREGGRKGERERERERGEMGNKDESKGATHSEKQ